MDVNSDAENWQFYQLQGPKRDGKHRSFPEKGRLARVTKGTEVSKTLSGQDPPKTLPTRPNLHSLTWSEGPTTLQAYLPPPAFLLPLLRKTLHSQWTGTFSSTNRAAAPLSSPLCAGLQSSLMGSCVSLPNCTQLRGLLARCAWNHSHGHPAKPPQTPLSLTSLFLSSPTIQSPTWSISLPAGGQA